MKTTFYTVLFFGITFCFLQSCSDEHNRTDYKQYRGISHIDNLDWSIFIENHRYTIVICKNDNEFARSTGAVKITGDSFEFFPDKAGDFLFPVIDSTGKYGYRARYIKSDGKQSIEFDSCDIKSRPHSVRL